MRWSRAHIPTLRETPAEAEIVSHQLMLRAGMIRRLATGIYSYLPLGYRVLLRMQKIIREEMDASGAQEVSLAFVQPQSIWQESGRWELYDKDMARFQDRHEHQFCLQPTSEEAIVDLVRKDFKSYRQLPANLYQVQTKFRDEIRPRFGIMRCREFLMKDAYSFDLDPQAARKSYAEMQRVYRRIFTRTGLAFRAVEADTGAIGGSDSEEFMVLAESGEDELISCADCGYAANQEKAIARTPAEKHEAFPAVEEVSTPGIKTIEALSKQLKVEPQKLMKTMIATDHESRCFVVLLRGDHELNLVKLEQALQKQWSSRSVRLAREDELVQWALPQGSLGPYRFPKATGIIVDEALSLEAPYVCGANQKDLHYRNVILQRDVEVDVQAVIRNVQSEESCAQCGGGLKSSRGIEVGHVFYLGTKYSEAMGLKVSLENGNLGLLEMGCYGIGVGRTVAACIEQNYDQSGIVWPYHLAPYSLGLVSLGEGRAYEVAQSLYQDLSKSYGDLLWDDRELSPGVKLKDMDLIGIPYQLIVGERSLKQEKVEWKDRRSGEKELIPLDEVSDKIQQCFEREEQRLQKALSALG